MDLQFILSALGRDRPDVFQALRVARGANHTPEVRAALDTLTTYCIKQYAEEQRLRAEAADLIKEVPTVGTKSYHALKPNPTILVKRICALAGIPHKSIAEDAP